MLLAFFVGLIGVGTLLLWLPVATASGQASSFLTALFTSTSAVCVTGLVVVDTGSHWSGFGQVVILFLMQIGGLGYASTSVLFLFLVRRRPNLNDRLTLQNAIGKITGQGVRRLSLFIVLTTLAIEGVGAVGLFIGWVGELGPAKATWWAIFHSVSAFTNGSFDLTGTAVRPFVSLTPYVSNPWISLTIPLLIILGGLGFVVFAEVLNYPRRQRLSVHVRVTLIGTLILLLGGTFFIWVVERDNGQTLGSLSLPEQVMAAFFHSVCPRTAGFNTINLPGLRSPTILLLIALMFIGGGTGSTAGGLRISTLGVVLASFRSVLLSRPAVVLLDRTMPGRVVTQALAVGAFYTFGISMFTLLISLFDTIPLRSIVFEVTSAFSTVGMSLGATVQLSDFSRVLLVLAMFIGRLGPILFILAFSQSPGAHSRLTYPEEEIPVS